MGDLIPWLPEGSSGFHLVVGAYSAPRCPDVGNESFLTLPLQSPCTLCYALQGIGDRRYRSYAYIDSCVPKILNCFLLLLLVYHSFIHRGVLIDSWVYYGGFGLRVENSVPVASCFSEGFFGEYQCNTP